MALVLRKGICTILDSRTVLVQTKRFRSKINIQKPKPPHFERAKYLALAKPWFISPNRDKKPIELCKNLETESKKDETGPLQKIIAKELYQRLTSSKLVAFYHLNPMSGDQQFKANVLFRKSNMHFENYGKKTLEIAVKGTPYESVLEFYVSHNMMVFSQEPDIKKLLKISKKFPQLILLAAIYEGRLISKDELVKYSMIPNLQTAQVNLLATLNGVGAELSRHLTSHQTTLISHLQERAKQLEQVKT